MSTRRVRTRARLASVAALSIALTAFACGPGGFNGLVGGAVITDAGVQADVVDEVRADDALAAPRPISPISVSWVATSRPRLRWELPDAATGAVVEMCRTRACASEGLKSYEASGTTLVVPEDLTPGVWFWRLRGRAPGRVGTVPSVTWEMVVRGPALTGSSDAPTGALVDVTGDGVPDLVSVGDDARDGPVLVVYHGMKDGMFPPEPDEGGAFGGPVNLPVYLGGGTDVDGDGYADLVHGGLITIAPHAGPFPGVGLEFGSDRGLDQNKLTEIDLPTWSNAPPLAREGGDINGDGYGDVLVASAEIAFVGLGVRDGPGSLGSAVLPFDYPGPDSGTAPAVNALLGAFDVDGDGIGDLAFAFDAPGVPGLALAGGRGVRLERTARLSVGGVADTSGGLPATAFASGDFNGDGIADLAFTAPLARGPVVCIALGDRKSVVTAGQCVAGLATEPDFGKSLTAADLEGDGKDELLVATKSGGRPVVQALHLAGSAIAIDAASPPGFGTHLTTIWPGHPGKARWAATVEGARGIGIFEGTRLTQTLAAPQRLTNFGRALR